MGANQSSGKRDLKLDASPKQKQKQEATKSDKLNKISGNRDKNNKSLGSSLLRNAISKAQRRSSANGLQSNLNHHHDDNDQHAKFNEMFVGEKRQLEQANDLIAENLLPSSTKESYHKNNNNNNNNVNSEIDRNFVADDQDDSFGFEANKKRHTQHPLANSLKRDYNRNSNNNDHHIQNLNNQNNSTYYHAASLKRSNIDIDSHRPIHPTGEIITTSQSRGSVHVVDSTSSSINNNKSEKATVNTQNYNLAKYYLNDEANSTPTLATDQHYQKQQVGYDPMKIAQFQKLTYNNINNNNNNNNYSINKHSNHRRSSLADEVNIINNGDNEAMRINVGGVAGHGSTRNHYEEYYYHGHGDDGPPELNEINYVIEHDENVSLHDDDYSHNSNGCNKENRQYNLANDSSNKLISNKIRKTSTPSKSSNNAQIHSKKANKSKSNHNNSHDVCLKSSPPKSSNNQQNNNHNSNGNLDQSEKLYTSHNDDIYDNGRPSNSSKSSSHNTQQQQQHLSRTQLNGVNHHAILNHHHHNHHQANNLADDIDNINSNADNENQRSCSISNPIEEDLMQQKRLYHNNIDSANSSEIVSKQNKKSNKINNLNNYNYKNNQYIVTANDFDNHKNARQQNHQDMQRQNINPSLGHEQQMTNKPSTVNKTKLANSYINKDIDTYQFPYQPQQNYQSSTIYNHPNQYYDSYNANQHHASININNNNNDSNSGKQLFISENHLNYPPYQHQQQQPQPHLQLAANYTMSPSNNNYNLNSDHQQFYPMSSNRYYHPSYQYRTSNNQVSMPSQLNTSAAMMQHQHQIPTSYVPYGNQPVQHPQSLLDFHRLSLNQPINYRHSNQFYQPHPHQTNNSNLISHKFEAANNLLPTTTSNAQYNRFLTDDDLLYQYQSKTNYNPNNDLRTTTLSKQGNNSSSFGGRLSWFGSKSSQTLDSKAYKRTSNPFASLFGSSSSSKSSSHNQDHKNRHSNTIHLGRSNKSSPNVMAISSTSQSDQLTNNLRSAPGSLKRIKSSPLTAQQASYEAMRTIDMYMIRQIARSCMNPVLEQKIDVEIRLRELAARAMLEARDEIDALEVEKSLLTSDLRMNCYSAELERQRKQLSNGSLSTDSGRGSSKSQQRLRSATRSDVIGPAGADTSSSSPALSSPQSTSKLSPVSGQSADLPSLVTTTSSKSRNTSKCSSGDKNSEQLLTSSGASQTKLSGENQQQQQQAFSPVSSRNCLVSRLARRNNKQREQLMQKITSSSNINCNMVMDNRASLSVSEIRIPLMWRDVDHFKGRGDYKRFAVFCLLKIDSQIYDTQLISDVDRNVTDITFDDVICFNEINHNFELSLEVYSCVYMEQFSLASTPRKLKEKLTSSVSKAMGRRLATQTASANFTKELEAYDKSYRFELIASANLRLSDAGQSIKTYDLVIGQQPPGANYSSSSSSYKDSFELHKDHLARAFQSVDSSSDHHHHRQSVQLQQQQPSYASSTLGRASQSKNGPPLFGHFCCKLLVRPDVFDKNIKAGYLRVAIINVPNESESSKNDNQLVQDAENNNNRLSTSSSSSLSTPGNKTTNSTRTSTHDPNLGFHTNKSSPSSDSKRQLQTALVQSTKMATLPRSNLKLYWALLRNFVLYLWPIEDASQQQEEEISKMHTRTKSAYRQPSEEEGRPGSPYRGIHEPDFRDQSASHRRASSSAANYHHHHHHQRNQQAPKYMLNIDRYTRLLRVSNSSLTLNSKGGCFVLASASQYEYSAKSGAQVDQNDLATSQASDEIGSWLRPIEQYIYDSHIWGSILNHHPDAS